MMMLKVDNLVVRYGGHHRGGRSFPGAGGARGPWPSSGANGAGKTTTLHTISGLLKAAGGKNLFFRTRRSPKCPPRTWWPGA